MRCFPALRLLSAPAALLLLAACASQGPMRVTDADQPRAVGEGTPVQVHWGDPAGFTELRYSPNRRQASQGDWVAELGTYVSRRIARVLPAGERVDVEILDLERAGELEWWGSMNDDIRVMRPIYAPRMRVQFRRFGSDGALIAEGARTLTDLAYLDGPQPVSSSDPLRYEKRMVDRWVQREFGRPVTRR
jgi:hypothetical protein